MGGRAGLPTCAVCCEKLGRYGGPATLPCGHNGCLHCLASVQQRQAACPLCRAPFPPGAPLVVNHELRDLMHLAAALTTVEGADGWQAVTCRVDGAEEEWAPPTKGSGAAAPPSAPPLAVDVKAVIEGMAPAMALEPPRWMPDSASARCCARGCGKGFSLVRARHHCRACGLLYCAACSAGRLLLPPRFHEPAPQRVCAACAELLAPLQPLLAGTVAPAASPPVHDALDWAAWRALLNPPLSSGLARDVYKAANILRGWAAAARGDGPTAPAERGLPRAALAGAAGLAVLSLLRVGAGWGGGLGTGLVVARRPAGGWSPPSALLALSMGAGWQLGAELVDLVVVLRSPEAVSALAAGQLRLAAGAGVAAGPLGRSASAGVRLGAGGGALCATYAVSRGAFAGVALEGAVLRPRAAANHEFYGRRVAPAALLGPSGPAPPPGAAPLYAALEELEDAAAAAGSQEAAGRGPRSGRQFLEAAEPDRPAAPAPPAAAPGGPRGGSEWDDGLPRDWLGSDSAHASQVMAALFD